MVSAELWFLGMKRCHAAGGSPAASSSRVMLAGPAGVSVPVETCHVPDGCRSLLAKLSVFKEQNGPKNFILPRDWEQGAGWDGGEHPRRMAGRVVCLPSSGLPPEGWIFLCEVAGREL